ncbi:MAG: hypothetical protein JW780_08335, partial [Clostridiales bacterium]|nr:hypothetical protein [Clostridiales bacterium]
IHTVIFIYNQAYYAIGKTKMPLFSGMISLFVVTTANYFLISANPDPKPIYLTLAYALASLVSASFLSLYYRKNKELAPKGMLMFSMKAAISLLSLVCTLYLLNMINYCPTNKLTEVLYIALRAVIGLCVYIGFAALLKMPELKSFTNRIRARFQRT